MAETRTELSRDLGVFTVTMVGVGAMIGAGIFVLTGIAAGVAGPALILAFAANGIVTLLTAMAYAELGSAIPEAGGGYLWVKQGLPGPNAFLAGWMSWFAHAVAGSLYALGFAAYFAFMLNALGVESVLGIPPESIFFEKGLAIIIALAFVGINFKGVSETGLAGNIITVAKIIIILFFIASGLWVIFGNPSISTAKFVPLVPEGFGGIFTAMGLTYIAFEGYEIIVQAGEEVKNPKKNIPRAVFWSLAIVIPIYILVGIVCIGATTPEFLFQALNELGGEIPAGVSGADPNWQILGHLGEVGLAVAATEFMPLGTVLLVIGGLLSTMSALNATTFSSTRVSFAMGRDKNLPDFFGMINAKTRTPYLALLASGGLIIFVALTLPIHDVAAATDIMFLLLFLQVNVAIITIRRKYGDKLDYGFLIPFFPVMPVIAIIMMIGIAFFLFFHSPIALLYVTAWIGAGFSIYYFYAKGREREKTVTPVVMEQTVRRKKEGYRVLVPVANPETSQTLINFGAMVARHKGGELMLLHVITVPWQAPYSVGQRYIHDARERVLNKAIEDASARDVPVSSVIRIARKPAQGIVDQVEDGDVDMVVMGWRGTSKHPHTTIGSNIDTVLRDSDCDVAVLRADDVDGIGKILIPFSFPEQAQLMMELGQMFVEEEQASLDLFHAVPPSMTEEQRQERHEKLYAGLTETREEGEQPVTHVPTRLSINIAETDNVVQEITRRSGDTDLTIIGAAQEGWLRKMVAGTIPEQIAKGAEGRLLLVKRRRSVLHSGFLNTIEFFRSKEEPTGQT